MFRIDAFSEVVEIRKATILVPYLDDMFHGLKPDALQCAERIYDRAITHIEVCRRSVYIRSQNRNFQSLGFLEEGRELVSVADIKTHRSGEKFDREMPLQVARMVTDQRIGRRVRFVETVAGELLHRIEDVVGELLFHALLLSRTFDKTLPLGDHLLDFLLTHGATQKVGFAEGVASDLLRHPHDLLLINRHAIGGLKDRFQVRMLIDNGGRVFLALDINRNVFHRTGAVE